MQSDRNKRISGLGGLLKSEHHTNRLAQDSSSNTHLVAPIPVSLPSIKKEKNSVDGFGSGGMGNAGSGAGGGGSGSGMSSPGNPGGANASGAGGTAPMMGWAAIAAKNIPQSQSNASASAAAAAAAAAAGAAYALSSLTTDELMEESGKRVREKEKEKEKENASSFDGDKGAKSPSSTEIQTPVTTPVPHVVRVKIASSTSTSSSILGLSDKQDSVKNVDWSDIKDEDEGEEEDESTMDKDASSATKRRYEPQFHKPTHMPTSGPAVIPVAARPAWKSESVQGGVSSNVNTPSQTTSTSATVSTAPLWKKPVVPEPRAPQETAVAQAFAWEGDTKTTASTSSSAYTGPHQSHPSSAASFSLSRDRVQGSSLYSGGSGGRSGGGYSSSYKNFGGGEQKQAYMHHEYVPAPPQQQQQHVLAERGPSWRDSHPPPHHAEKPVDESMSPQESTKPASAAIETPAAPAVKLDEAQEEFMKRAAERAAQRKREEDERMAAQKEAAARKLAELEKRIHDKEEAERRKKQEEKEEEEAHQREEEERIHREEEEARLAAEEHRRREEEEKERLAAAAAAAAAAQASAEQRLREERELIERSRGESLASRQGPGPVYHSSDYRNTGPSYSSARGGPRGGYYRGGSSGRGGSYSSRGGYVDSHAPSDSLSSPSSSGPQYLLARRPEGQEHPSHASHYGGAEISAPLSALSSAAEWKQSDFPRLPGAAEVPVSEVLEAISVEPERKEAGRGDEPYMRSSDRGISASHAYDKPIHGRVDGGPRSYSRHDESFAPSADYHPVPLDFSGRGSQSYEVRNRHGEGDSTAGSSASDALPSEQLGDGKYRRYEGASEAGDRRPYQGHSRYEGRDHPAYEKPNYRRPYSEREPFERREDGIGTAGYYDDRTSEYHRREPYYRERGGHSAYYSGPSREQNGPREYGRGGRRGGQGYHYDDNRSVGEHYRPSSSPEGRYDSPHGGSSYQKPDNSKLPPTRHEPLSSSPALPVEGRSSILVDSAMPMVDVFASTPVSVAEGRELPASVALSVVQGELEGGVPKLPSVLGEGRDLQDDPPGLDKDEEARSDVSLGKPSYSESQSSDSHDRGPDPHRREVRNRYEQSRGERHEYKTGGPRSEYDRPISGAPGSRDYRDPVNYDRDRPYHERRERVYHRGDEKSEFRGKRDNEGHLGRREGLYADDRRLHGERLSNDEGRVPRKVGGEYYPRSEHPPYRDYRSAGLPEDSGSRDSRPRSSYDHAAGGRPEHDDRPSHREDRRVGSEYVPKRDARRDEAGNYRGSMDGDSDSQHKRNDERPGGASGDRTYGRKSAYVDYRHPKPQNEDLHGESNRQDAAESIDERPVDESRESEEVKDESYDISRSLRPSRERKGDSSYRGGKSGEYHHRGEYDSSRGYKSGPPATGGRGRPSYGPREPRDRKPEYDRHSRSREGQKDEESETRSLQGDAENTNPRHGGTGVETDMKQTDRKLISTYGDQPEHNEPTAEISEKAAVKDDARSTGQDDPGDRPARPYPHGRDPTLKKGFRGKGAPPYGERGSGSHEKPYTGKRQPPPPPIRQERRLSNNTDSGKSRDSESVSEVSSNLPESEVRAGFVVSGVASSDAHDTSDASLKPQNVNESGTASSKVGPRKPYREGGKGGGAGGGGGGSHSDSRGGGPDYHKLRGEKAAGPRGPPRSRPDPKASQDGLQTPTTVAGGDGGKSERAEQPGSGATVADTSKEVADDRKVKPKNRISSDTSSLRDKDRERKPKARPNNSTGSNFVKRNSGSGFKKEPSAPTVATVPTSAVVSAPPAVSGVPASSPRREEQDSGV